MFSNLAKSFLIFLCTISTAISSVTITGTRIVFPGNSKDEVVRLNNKDNSTPALVQVWIDDGININDINNKDIPFVVTPPVSRIEPLKGQSIRLIYNGMSLPQDKESIYYFNALEIPSNSNDNSPQRLDIAFKTRIKLFYRPVGLMKSSSLQENDKLTFEVVSNAQKGTGVKIHNPTPYYFNFSEIKVTMNGKPVDLDSDMIAPGKTGEFYSGKEQSGSISEINYSILDDYGSPRQVKMVKGAGTGFTEVKK